MLFTEQAEREFLVILPQADNRIPAAENLGAVLCREGFTQGLPVLQKAFLDAGLVGGGLLQERNAERLRRCRDAQVSIFHKLESRTDRFELFSRGVECHPAQFELRRTHSLAEAVQPENGALGTIRIRRVFLKRGFVDAIGSILPTALYFVRESIVAKNFVHHEN